MTLTEILEQIRGVYLAEFAARLDGYAADVSEALLTQALYATAEGEPLRSGALNLPARGDVCVMDNHCLREIARIDAARSVRFDAFRFVWDNRLQVAMNPFAWSNCPLCIPEPALALDFEPLANWFEQQVKAALPAERGSARLLEVAHSMTEPRSAADGVRFEIDFGSMPVVGFEALLNACAQTGAGLLVIGRVAAPSNQVGKI